MLPSGASGGLAVEEPGGQEDAADDDRDIDDGHEGGHRAGGVPNSYERLPREWLSTIRKKNATPPSTNSVVPAPGTPVRASVACDSLAEAPSRDASPWHFRRCRSW